MGQLKYIEAFFDKVDQAGMRLRPHLQRHDGVVESRSFERSNRELQLRAARSEARVDNQPCHHLLRNSCQHFLHNRTILRQKRRLP
jgi:hypothetical protein